MQPNSESVQELKSLLKTTNNYQKINNFLTFVAICSVPFGILIGQSMLSICGIVWLTSNFCMFCSCREVTQREQIQLQIDLLDSMSRIENTIKDKEPETIRVSFGPMGLN